MTIKELRAKTGMSQSEFAEHFNIPSGSLRNWEQDIRKPPEYLVGLLEKGAEHDNLFQKQKAVTEQKNTIAEKHVAKVNDFNAFNKARQANVAVKKNVRQQQAEGMDVGVKQSQRGNEFGL